MAGWKYYVQQLFGLIATIGAIAAFGGLLALVIVALKIAAISGVEVYVTIPLTEQQTQQLGIAGGIALFGGMVSNLLGNTVSSFVEGFRTAPEHSAQSGESDQPKVPVSERYRRRLETVYLANFGVVAVVVVIGALGSQLAPDSTSVIGFVALFANLIVKILFGGVVGGIVVAGVLGGLWYGVKQRASEALVAGFAIAVLFLPVALLSRSAGFVIFALLLGYYSIFSRGATEFKLVSQASVPPAVRDFVD
jgi:hypothetical protein